MLKMRGSPGLARLAAYDVGAAAQDQTNVMTPGWSAATIPQAASGAAAGLHSPKRTGWSC